MDTGTDDEIIGLLQQRIKKTSEGASALSPSHRNPSPATPRAVLEAEEELGFVLHPLLRRIYLEVRNGALGPGYGLLKLRDVGRRDEDRTLVAVYNDFRAHDWPDKLLPLWDWGDAIWSCVDHGVANGTIVTHDIAGSTETDFDLRSWLWAWLEGVDLWQEIYEDRDATILNPFTRKPIATKIRGLAKGRARKL